MAKVSEEKPRLFHYTTAGGLIGIVRSQQIHATSIRFLNDSKEQFGYLDHRLPSLLRSAVVDILRTREVVESNSEGESPSPAEMEEEATRVVAAR